MAAFAMLDYVFGLDDPARHSREPKGPRRDARSGALAGGGGDPTVNASTGTARSELP